MRAMTTEEIQERLAEAMHRRKVGVNQVARETGISKGTISKIMHQSRKSISQEVGLALARWFDLPEIDRKAIMLENGDAMPAIKRIVENDENLDREAKYYVISVMQAGYDALALPF